MRRTTRLRLALVLFVAPVAALFVGVGGASAATLAVDPGSVVAGGSVTITGGDWINTVTLTFKKGNAVLQAGTADAGPNGGPISATRSAPNDPGAWQVCADGTNLVDGLQVGVCANLTVTAPSTTAAPTTTVASTTTRPPTTTVAPTTTTAETTTTLAPVTVAPVSIAPAELPLGPDGITDVDEETVTTPGSRPSGLAIGVAVGIVALAGIAVVGLSTSVIGVRPRPRVAIAVGIVGVLVAGGSAIAIPPPKVNVPKLELSRVQTTASLKRGSTLRTFNADCPAGEVVVGGGFASTWDSTNRSDLGFLINWMETETRGSVIAGGKTFVLPFNMTQVISTVGASMPTPPGGVATRYWNAARVDGTVHLSDQVWDSKQESAASANERERRSGDGLDPGAPTFIKHSDAVVAAAGDYFYMLHDAQATSRADMPGLQVTQSKPDRSSWIVTAALSKNSLMPEVSVTVVAICAPDANNTDEPGVIGAHVVGEEGASSVSCPTGEVVTAVGWTIAPPGFVRTARLSGSTVDVEGGSAYAVCVRSDGVSVSSGTGRVEAKTVREGTASAPCPAGSSAVSGGMTTTYTHPAGSVFENLPQNVVGAAPVGSGFSVTLRGVAEYWPVAKAGAKGVDVDGAIGIYGYDSYEKLSTSAADITSLCIRRVP